MYAQNFRTQILQHIITILLFSSLFRSVRFGFFKLKKFFLFIRSVNFERNTWVKVFPSRLMRLYQVVQNVFSQNV